MFERMFSAVLAVLGDGNLTQNPNRTSGADVVAALGCCDPLGAALLRVHATRTQASWQEAARRLAERVAPKTRDVDMEAYRRIALIALMEYVDRACDHCRGTGIRYDDRGVRRTCGACGGTGQRTPSSRVRATALGVSSKDYRALESVFSKCHWELKVAEADAGAMMSYKLGARKTPPPKRKP